MLSLLPRSGGLSGVEAVVDAVWQSFPNGWAQLAAEDLNAELGEAGGPVLVDVRTTEEVAGNGIIEGAVNIPLEQMVEARNEWPGQGAEIVIYSADGYRGNMAMTIMRMYGYQNVRSLKGGFAAWQEAGLPVTTQ